MGRAKRMITNTSQAKPATKATPAKRAKKLSAGAILSVKTAGNLRSAGGPAQSLLLRSSSCKRGKLAVGCALSKMKRKEIQMKRKLLVLIAAVGALNLAA